MNDFYEAVANLLEELRCDPEEREYAIKPEDMKEADAELKRANKKFGKYLTGLSDKDKAFLEEYQEAVEHAHFKEEQRAYYQGIMDGVQLLGGLGLIRKGGNMKKLISKVAE
ncbi:hypothetical protein [Parablautia sp. Marseille-Q6255]|uniref:hypothetical protein n=1 Tax=Parablautia sp. Marseille-Q6255 TaxID=3039593 RepID=UPI0024BBF21C|nr:hypothetical protein [Parablautia sp. Marseille-Q6255]